MMRTMSGRVSVLNPTSSVATEYRPGGSDGSRYSPALSVTPTRVNPFSTLRAVTVAPGMIPPLESFTIPVICAFWAKADGASASQNTNAANPADPLPMRASLCRQSIEPVSRRAGCRRKGAVQNKRASRDCDAPLLR